MNILFLAKIFEKDAKRLKAKGHKIFLINDKSFKIKAQTRKLIEKIWVVDLFNSASITDTLVEEIKLESIDVVVNAYESFILCKSEISSRLGLASLTSDAALKASDKVLMRQAFSENYPEITPQFSEIGSLEDAEKFAIEYGYPVMLKPANLAKSLLISRCNDKNDLAKHYQYMQEQIGNLYAIKVKSKQPKILIEQYLEGSLFSVDLLTNEQGDVTSFDPVELIFAKDIGIDDNHNFARFLPMSSGQEKARELKLTAAKAARAIGLTNSPAHVELIVTKNGIFVIEIGARWGGYRPQMHLLAQGLDLIELELSVLNGGEIDTATSIANHVAVIELFSNTTGIYKGITGIEQVKDLRSYYSMINHSKLGTLIGLAKYGYSPVASILLSSKDKEQLDKDYTFIKDNLVVEVV